MSIKSFVREWKEMKNGFGSISQRSRSKTHIAPDQIMLSPPESIQQSPWANLPAELLLDIIRKVEESETLWPARASVVSSASVCRSWRKITKEIVETPEQCGRLTFPISLKQPGPRESQIQCFIKRDRASSTYLLYYGLVPSENASDKLLLAARRIRRATCTDFVISLVADEFSRSSNNYVGKLRSNFLGTRFVIYDSQPPSEASFHKNNRSKCRFNSKQVAPRVSACNYNIGTISYELNVLGTRGPRRMHCIMNSIPVSSIQQGGSAPTPASFLPSYIEHISFPPVSKGKESVIVRNCDPGTTVVASPSTSLEPLVLKSKGPRWHEQLQCWCLNFKGRVTVASVKNLQLVADVDPSHNVTEEEQEKVNVQFGKIGKDMFTMDYCYPLSAFQAFAICLSSFDTKAACE